MELPARDRACDGARRELAALETVCERLLEYTPRVLELAGAGQPLARQTDQRAAGERPGGVGRCRYQPLRSTKIIERARIDPARAAGFGLEIEPVAHFLEQALLENPQRRLDEPAPRSGLFEDRERLVVGIEQAGMRIVACRELQEQLAQVEAGHQAGRVYEAARRGYLRARELRRLPAPAPGQQQRLKRLQHRAELCLRSAHAPGKESVAPMIAGQDLENAARITIGLMVQGVAGRQPDAARVTCAHSSPSCFSARALSAQPLRTFTHSSRCKRWPSSRLSSSRAERPTRFSRSPPAPITIGFWPSRSTQIAAETFSCPSSCTSRSISTAIPYGSS